jgi:hypothetical protein
VPVVLEVQKDYDEKIKQAVVDHVSKLLKQGKITEASNLLEKALNRQVKLKE